MKTGILKRFARDREGAAYVTAAIILVPLLGMGGLAVDYTIAVRKETALNTAAQAVALNLARRTTLNPNIPAETLVDEGKGLIAAMVPGEDIEYAKFRVEPGQGKVTIDATIETPTLFMQLLATDSLTIRTQTQAQFGRRNVEVAIAMDVTGSMDRWAHGKRKIDAAKEAARKLIQAATASMQDFDNANLRFSLVPWTSVVRVPLAYRGDETEKNDRWWIDWDGQSTGHFNYLAPYSNDGGMYFPMGPDNDERHWSSYRPVDLAERLLRDPDREPNDPGNSLLEPDGNGIDINALNDMPGINIITRRDVFQRFTNVEWAGCFEHRHGDYRFSFDRPTTIDGDSLYVPFFAPDEDDREHVSFTNQYIDDIVWANRLTVNRSDEDSRVLNSVKYAGAPDEISTQFGSPNGWCSRITPLVPLTDDLGTLENAINNMRPEGSTDLTIGLSWAMNTLTPWEPLEEGVGSFDETEKILVFMTDGDNHPYQPHLYSDNYTSFQYVRDGIVNNNQPWWPSQNSADSVFDEASKNFCTSIKEKGVLIYFVYFGSASIAAKDVMKHCASDPDTTAIEATSPQKLIDAFERIGDEIGKLRLTPYDGS